MSLLYDEKFSIGNNRNYQILVIPECESDISTNVVILRRISDSQKYKNIARSVIKCDHFYLKEKAEKAIRDKAFHAYIATIEDDSESNYDLEVYLL